MLPAFITHADCARHEMGPDHPECPERLGAIKDMLLVQGLLDYMQPVEAPTAKTPNRANGRSENLFIGLGLPEKALRHLQMPCARGRIQEVPIHPAKTPGRQVAPTLFWCTRKQCGKRVGLAPTPVCGALAVSGN